MVFWLTTFVCLSGKAGIDDTHGNPPTRPECQVVKYDNSMHGVLNFFFLSLLLLLLMMMMRKKSLLQLVEGDQIQKNICFSFGPISANSSSEHLRLVFFYIFAFPHQVDHQKDCNDGAWMKYITWNGSSTSSRCLGRWRALLWQLHISDHGWQTFYIIGPSILRIFAPHYTHWILNQMLTFFKWWIVQIKQKGSLLQKKNWKESRRLHI